MRFLNFNVPLLVMAKCGHCGAIEEVESWTSVNGAEPVPYPGPRKGWGIVPLRDGESEKIWACERCFSHWRQIMEHAAQVFHNTPAPAEEPRKP